VTGFEPSIADDGCVRLKLTGAVGASRRLGNSPFTLAEPRQRTFTVRLGRAAGGTMLEE